MEWGILIPLAGIVMGVSIPITAIKLRHREKIEQMRLAATGGHDSAHATQQDARIELLEDRIAVLERIVTDKGYDLAHQIEALRDSGRVAMQETGAPLGINRQQERQG